MAARCRLARRLARPIVLRNETKRMGGPAPSAPFGGTSPTSLRSHRCACIDRIEGIRVFGHIVYAWIYGELSLRRLIWAIRWRMKYTLKTPSSSVGRKATVESRKAFPMRKCLVWNSTRP